MDHHLGQQHGTRLDNDHDEEGPLDNSASKVDVDTQMEDTHEPPSAQSMLSRRMVWMLKLVLLKTFFAIRVLCRGREDMMVILLAMTRIPDYTSWLETIN